MGSIPGSERSPGGGNGNQLQYSCLENPYGQRSLVSYTVHGVTKCQTQLRDWAQTIISSVQSLSRVWLFVIPWTPAHQASLSIANSQCPPRPMSIESVMPSNHLILCRPLLLLPSIFPSMRVFSLSQFFTSGGQSIGVSASTSVLPMNTQDWSPLGWTGWISLQSKGLSTVFSYTTAQKHSSSVFSFLYSPTLTSMHDHWKNHNFD